MKASRIPELFPFSEVIGWVLSKADAKGVIMYNVEDRGYASFTPAFKAKSYNFLVSEVSMTNDSLNSLTINYIGCVKMMTMEGKSF